jgi:DUF4097 and DUF4098 domain-containing protein YvlB
MNASVEKPAPRSLGGLILPLILIGLGVAFLLANLGYLPPISIRALADMWPIVLILIGIEILLGRRQPVLGLALQLVALALAVAIVASQSAGLLTSAAATTSSDTVARDGATALALDLDGHAGDISVTGGASGLVETRSTGGAVKITTDREGGTAEVGIEPEHELVLPFQGLRTDLDVVLASDVPASIKLDIGAGDVRLDLRDLRITSVNVDAGAGDISVTLPVPEGVVAIEIDAGAADVTIEVPSGVEARVTVAGGVVSLESSNSRLVASGGAAETAGYATASSRVTVTIEGGAASVHIR